MYKWLKDIPPQHTSHFVGQKRILLHKEETESSLTQIAITTLQAGESAEKHIHISMEEYFFFLEGTARMKIEDKIIDCKEGDFVQVKCQKLHNLEAITNIKVLTIGVGLPCK